MVYRLLHTAADALGLDWFVLDGTEGKTLKMMPDDVAVFIMEYEHPASDVKVLLEVRTKQYVVMEKNEVVIVLPQCVSPSQ